MKLPFARVEARRRAACITLLAALAAVHAPAGAHAAPVQGAAPAPRKSTMALPTSSPTSASLPPMSTAARLHALAVEKFRQGRFPEAYGRLVQLANAGHAPSARLALWMCAEGPELFGSDWDCTPDEVADWTDSVRSAGAASKITPALMGARALPSAQPVRPSAAVVR